MGSILLQTTNIQNALKLTKMQLYTAIFKTTVQWVRKNCVTFQHIQCYLMVLQHVHFDMIMEQVCFCFA